VILAAGSFDRKKNIKSERRHSRSIAYPAMLNRCFNEISFRITAPKDMTTNGKAHQNSTLGWYRVGLDALNASIARQ
jgi:hypothetical protein